MRRHICTEKCKCPIHKTPLYYHDPTKTHACQKSDCKYSKDYEQQLSWDMHKQQGMETNGK